MRALARGTASSPISVVSLSPRRWDSPSSGSSPSASRPATPPAEAAGADANLGPAPGPAPATPSRKTAVGPPTPSGPLTPSRPRALLPAPSPVRTPPRTKPVHPFFLRRQVPAPARPRLIADYCSTEPSESSFDSHDSSLSPSLAEQRSPLMEGSRDAERRAILLARARIQNPTRHRESPAEERGDHDSLSLLLADMALSDQRSDSPRRLPVLVPRPRTPPVEATTFKPHDTVGVEKSVSVLSWNRAVGRRQPSAWEDDVFLGVESRSVSTTSVASTTSLAASESSVASFATAASTLSVTGRLDNLEIVTPRPQPRRRQRTKREPFRGAYSEATDLPPFSLLTPLPGHFTTPPTIVYTTSPSEADDLVSCLRGPVGFDMEWPLYATTKAGKRKGVWDAATRSYTWPQGRTAVIQLSDMRMVVVIHLSPQTQLGPGIRGLLADQGRMKVGVNIKNDARKLVRDGLMVPGEPKGMLDLSGLARAADPDLWGGHYLVALARQSRRYLGSELAKGAVRTGAWDEALDQEQLEYAANDAFAGLLIYREQLRRIPDPSVVEKLEEIARAPVGGAGDVATTTWDQAGEGYRTRVPPAQSNAFRLFAQGLTIEELAGTLGVKEGTALSYLAAAAAARVEIEPALAGRILAAVPAESYTGKKHKALLATLRAQAAEERALAEVPPNIA